MHVFVSLYIASLQEYSDFRKLLYTLDLLGIFVFVLG